MITVPFTKPPLSLCDQVDLLRHRGMEVPHQAQAEESLLRLNYYRFSGYALHFEIFNNGERTHQFKPGTRFDDVVRLYEFDNELRTLLFRYIRPVEIAFRGAVCYELSVGTGDSHWYLDPVHYQPRFEHDNLRSVCERECERSDEIFIKSYRQKYTPVFPPAWMMSEVLSLGQWSKIYKSLADAEAKKQIAQHFSTRPRYLESWIYALSVLRNLCAHHCRVWNRSFTICPSLPKSLKPLVVNNRGVAALALVLTHLLKPLHKNAEFQREWNALLTAHPEVPICKMGLLPPSSGRVSR